MMKSVVTAVIKFLFLMVFPALLSPSAFAESTVIQSVEVHHAKTKVIISPESHSSSYTLISEVELKETAEAEAHLTTHPFEYQKLEGSDSHVKATHNSLDHPHTVVSFLSYLSLFSISPPTQS